MGEIFRDHFYIQHFEYGLEMPPITYHRTTNDCNNSHATARALSVFSVFGKMIAEQTQGSHRLEKYFNLEGFLEKSLKNKSALKSTGKSLKSLENP